MDDRLVEHFLACVREVEKSLAGESAVYVRADLTGTLEHFAFGS
jgi:hypothetical protein